MAFGLLYFCDNPYCRTPFDSAKSAKSHMRQAKSCRDWEKQVNRAVKARFKTTSKTAGTVHDDSAPVWADNDDNPGDIVPPEDRPEPYNAPTEHSYDPADPPVADEDAGANIPGAEIMREIQEVLEDPEDLFEVVDVNPQAPAGQASSSGKNRSTQPLAGAKPRFLERNDTSPQPVFEEHPTAATVIRMADHLHRRWADLFGVDTAGVDTKMDGSGEPDIANINIYHPFASKMDWEVAKWMVKDGIGHSSFNRLLDIEGVSSLTFLASEQC